MIDGTQWVPQSSRERRLIREIESARREGNRLRGIIQGSDARFERLKRNVDNRNADPPPAKGEVLRPGAVGYITHVKITAQGRVAFDNEDKLTLSDMLILGIANVNAAGTTFDKIAELVPKEVAESARVISYANLLDQRGLLEITYEPEPVNA